MLNNLILLASALVVLGVWQTRTRADGKAGADERFHATVVKVIDDASVIVTQIEIETLPGAWVQVVSDKPDRGGGGVAVPARTDGPSRTRIVIFADHVAWKAGPTNALKFMMTIQGGAGSASTSETRPMPEARRLADVLTVAITSGEYRYGAATKLATFKDVTYRLVVQRSS